MVRGGGRRETLTFSSSRRGRRVPMFRRTVCAYFQSGRLSLYVLRVPQTQPRAAGTLRPVLYGFPPPIKSKSFNADNIIYLNYL